MFTGSTRYRKHDLVGGSDHAAPLVFTETFALLFVLNELLNGPSLWLHAYLCYVDPLSGGGCG